MKTTVARVFAVVWICLPVCCPVARAYDWQPRPDKVTVLAIHAHPDDEGIFFGGALPYYSAVLQVPTMILCMTAGLDTVRDEELRCAAWTYGLRYEPVYGRFRDVNSAIMSGTSYGTNTIDITWDYWADGLYQGDGSDVEAGKARAINYVAEQIRRYRPDVILTMDVNGETGHDNHKATSYAVRMAFYVAADASATAPNLAGLPPWQAQKLYVHLYPTNRLFHEYWESPFPALADKTPHQVVNTGLTCHVSQGPSRWTCGSVYPPASTAYYAWPSEWWGLYASTVGPDSVLSADQLVNGYSVPAGVGLGDFLEHVSVSSLYFTSIPRSTTVGASSLVSLAAAAKSTGSGVEYHWEYNGVTIDGATAAVLRLADVQVADAGSYTVIASSSANSITSPPAVLTVISPPIISASLQTRTNLAGTMATFSASASGEGPLSYQWLLNGTPLHDSVNIRGATATNLQFTSVQPTNAGSLVLKVSNLGGVTVAPVANLVVLVPPPCAAAPPDLVSWWPADGDVADLAGGSEGLLQGNANANAPGKVGQAFAFDGASGFIRIPDSPRLRPANLTIEGWVQFNSLDSPASGNSPPGQQFIVFKQNSRTSYFEGYSLAKTRTANGDVFSFTVSSASGQPAAIYSTSLITTGAWYHVAAERGPAFIALYVNGRLENQSSAGFPQDYGTNALFFGSSGQSYWDHKLNGLLDDVSLYNRALTESEVAAIYAAGVAGKCREASVSVQPGSQTVIVGSNAVYLATAYGPGVSYQWFYNRTNLLPGETNSYLLLTNVDYSQSGSYSVAVSNFAGAVMSAPVALLVTRLPGIVMPLRLYGAAGSSWRIDYRNDLYATNNWFPLATVTLTNASQMYFDSTALTQRQRFYRLVPLQ